MRNEFMDAMNFRHACKLFDETKKISDEDIKYILESGRKSPTSFGMEAWKFLVITNEELKAKLDFYMKLYEDHLKETLSTDENIYHWTSKHVYIASANMMTSAAFLDID